MENQIKYLKPIVKQNGWALVDIYKDDGFTGTNFERPGFKQMLEDIEKGNVGIIPEHIKTDSTSYKYPHNYPGAYVVQQYLPDKIKNKKYYTPKDIGYEKNMKEIYDKLEKIRKHSSLK